MDTAELLEYFRGENDKACIYYMSLEGKHLGPEYNLNRTLARVQRDVTQKHLLFIKEWIEKNDKE